MSRLENIKMWLLAVLNEFVLMPFFKCAFFLGEKGDIKFMTFKEAKCLNDLYRKNGTA